MSGDTLYEAPRKHNVLKMRVHDYLYDPAYIVSGARDYARTAFRAAMASAQVSIQPVYSTMFSELRKFPRTKVVYHGNCRLPHHIDRSYNAYVERVSLDRNLPSPNLAGRDRYLFTAAPKKVLPVTTTSPDFHPPSPLLIPTGPTKPMNRGTQSLFRESSAQTYPWQPDGKPAEICEQTPEVLYLDKLEWGPGKPYRLGDLPADFHTTEIINKMRHARTWTELVEKAQFPRWMKKRDSIICDVETKDWIFREAEIDELQEIRLELLHRMQADLRNAKNNKTSKKLAQLWTAKKTEMERKIENIRHARDRELRKLTALHGGGGRPGLVGRMRAARGGGSMTAAAQDPASELYAPLIRHGYQARRRHAEITYDPALLSLEDHRAIAEPPAWLTSCGHDLTRTCSGHHLPRDPTQLCERQSKWSEDFLAKLHNDLKKARIGAAASGSLGPLHVIKPRHVPTTPRPATPCVAPVNDWDEEAHQAALVLQRAIRGRAVHNLMYEGRTRAAELTEEMKTTHGLQKEDRIRIAKEEAKAREYNAVRTLTEQKENAISALVDELCGGAVSAALDFLEKELRRLKEERRQHAFLLVALREKTMREAAEAGRRQKEEHRRREHDEMFRQILGVTQETVEEYLNEITKEGVELAAEEDAVKLARVEAEKIDASINYNESLSTAEQHELVAELVWQCIVGGAPRVAARRRLAVAQEARADAVREKVFGLLDEAEIKEIYCTQCGCPLDELCRCTNCPIKQRPATTSSRDDPRWKYARMRPKVPQKQIGDRVPPAHEFRYMLGTLVEEAIQESRVDRTETCDMALDFRRELRERTERTIEINEMIELLLDRATGKIHAPPKPRHDYHYYSVRRISDALARTEPYPTPPCPLELPSEIRRRADEAAAELGEGICQCQSPMGTSQLPLLLPYYLIGIDIGAPEDPATALLPSALRILNDMKRCKCDQDTDATTPNIDDVGDTTTDADATVTGEASPEPRFGEEQREEQQQ